MIIHYNTDVDSTWRLISLIGDTSELLGEEYMGTITWQSINDQPHVDLSVNLRASVIDNWGSGPSFYENDIPLDNEIGPQLLSEDTLWIYPHPDTIFTLSFDLPIAAESVIEDNIYITSLPGITLDQITSYDININRPDGYPANSTIGVTISHALLDTLGKEFDGDRDGDPSGTDDDYTIYLKTHYLADFNQDNKIGGTDLSAFVDGWYNEDGGFETGPVNEDYEEGASNAQFILKPDDVFNIEDLMTFIRMWNFCADSLNDCDETPVLLAAGTQDNGSLTTSYNGNTLSLGFDQGHLPSVAEFTLEYNSETITLGRAYSDTLRAAPEKSILFEKKTQDPNLRNQVLGYLEPMDKENDASWFIHFPFEIHGKD
ncbi:MAG TPA: hypothetical protein EYO18_08505, partial [Candidatus Marinimicrobia bacterium]|nr:hypothetical protein [Candidatus Neomarinimicrobiota bacterium]